MHGDVRVSLTSAAHRLAVVAVLAATVGVLPAAGLITVPVYTIRGFNVPFVNISVPGSAYSGLPVFDTGSPLFWLASPSNCPDGFAASSATGAVPLNRNTSFGYGGGYMEGPVFNVCVFRFEFLSRAVMIVK